MSKPAQSGALLKRGLRKIQGWLEPVPFGVLTLVSLWMLLAPIFPEPHLVQKAMWLIQGAPFKAIDVFDVAWHLLPSILLLIKWLKLS